MTKILTFVEANWILLTLMILAAIFLLSLWPLDKLPSIPVTDKSHHILAYAILMFPTALRKPDGWVTIGLLFIIYSGAIELLQPYVNRYGDWLDMAANTTGIVCGLIIGKLVKYFSP